MIDDFDLEEDKEYPEELYPVLVQQNLSVGKLRLKR